MKTRQLIILGFFLLVSALIFFRLTSAKKTPVATKKGGTDQLYLPYTVVNNVLREFNISAYGQVNPTVSVDISFEVQGKLEQGEVLLKPGMKFRKNQLLYQVNNEEAYYTLNARKNQLANLVIGVLPDVELDFPSEKNKWVRFLESIKADDLLVPLPSFQSAREKMFFTSRNIIAEYYNIRSAEVRMKKYLFVAPFSGTVAEIFTEPGSLAGPGVRVARIVKTGDFEVAVPVSLKQIDFFKHENQATFRSADGQKIGTGKIIRVSDIINQRTQSVDVYYNIQVEKDALIYNGMYLTAGISRKGQEASFTIPRVALENGNVQILEDRKYRRVPVTVLGNKPDSLHVSGLKNGQKLLLERTDAGSKIDLIGIKR